VSFQKWLAEIGRANMESGVSAWQLQPMGVSMLAWCCVVKFVLVNFQRAEFGERRVRLLRSELVQDPQTGARARG
jgi:hypothetical protein